MKWSLKREGEEKKIHLRADNRACIAARQNLLIALEGTTAVGGVSTFN